MTERTLIEELRRGTKLENRAADEIERLRAVILEQGIKTGLLLGALSDIDAVAIQHSKGGIGKAQKIARDALRAHGLSGGQSIGAAK